MSIDIHAITNKDMNKSICECIHRSCIICMHAYCLHGWTDGRGTTWTTSRILHDISACKWIIHQLIGFMNSWVWYRLEVVLQNFENTMSYCHTPKEGSKKNTLLRVIPTVTSYYYIFVPNSDILCAKIRRGRGGEDNSDEIYNPSVSRFHRNYPLLLVPSPGWGPAVTTVIYLANLIAAIISRRLRRLATAPPAKLV